MFIKMDEGGLMNAASSAINSETKKRIGLREEKRKKLYAAVKKGKKEKKTVNVKVKSVQKKIKNGPRTTAFSEKHARPRLASRWGRKNKREVLEKGAGKCPETE